MQARLAGMRTIARRVDDQVNPFASTPEEALHPALRTLSTPQRQSDVFNNKAYAEHQRMYHTPAPDITMNNSLAHSLAYSRRQSGGQSPNYSIQQEYTGN